MLMHMLEREKKLEKKIKTLRSENDKLKTKVMVLTKGASKGEV